MWYSPGWICEMRGAGAGVEGGEEMVELGARARKLRRGLRGVTLKRELKDEVRCFS